MLIFQPERDIGSGSRINFLKIILIVRFEALTIESQSMLLAAVNDDESRVLILQSDGKIEEGSKIR